MNSSARKAIELGLPRIAPKGTKFPGRHGVAGSAVIFDVRGAIGNVALRALIVHELRARLEAHFPETEVIAGVAKAGISWAALLGWTMARPSAVVNVDGPRASGLQREIEGELQNRNVVLLDNLVRTGASLEAAATAVTRAGGRVVGALTVVADLSIKTQLPVFAAWTAPELAHAAHAAGYIDKQTLIELLS